MNDFKGHEMNYFGFKGTKRGKYVKFWEMGQQLGWFMK